MDPVTKLMVPGPNCAMLPASGHAGPIPAGYFVHPDTGRVLPEAGNLGYDLQRAALVPTTDFGSGETLTAKQRPPSPGLLGPSGMNPQGAQGRAQGSVLAQWGMMTSSVVKPPPLPHLSILAAEGAGWRGQRGPAGLGRGGRHVSRTTTSLPPCPGGVRTSEAAILPYVPYPTCPATGSPPAARLPLLQPRRTSQLGAVTTDPATGIEVPVLAVTLHPHTRQWLALGGTYCNPLTKTLAPLELGGPMEDPVTGGIWPILGVGLDEDTGVLAGRLGAVPSASPVRPWPPTPPGPLHPPCSRPGCKPPQTPLSTLPPHSALPHLHAVSPSPSPARVSGEEGDPRWLCVEVKGAFQPRGGVSSSHRGLYPSGLSPSPTV